MRLAAHIAAVIACAAFAQPLAAENVDATEPDKLARIIRDLGYRAQLDRDGVGDPMIRSSVGGVEFGIYFFGCMDNADCRTLLFKAGYDLADGATPDVVESWNEDMLFGRAYLDDEGDPWIEMAVNLHGGVSRLNFEDTYDWWEIVLDDFERHIEF